MALNNPKRVHIWMEEEDWEWYKVQFSGNVGFSKAVQTILHAWMVRMKAKAEAKAAGLPPGQLSEAELGLEDGA